MEGYLLDTNAASVLWDNRHRDHLNLREFFNKNTDAPIWISIIVFGEIEYGLKIRSRFGEESKKTIRDKMSSFSSYLLNIDKHTIEPYSDLRAALFQEYSPKNKRGKLKVKWPEDLIERTSAKELGVQENDIWIAAQAIQYNLILITNDFMRRLEEVSRQLNFPLQLASWR